MQLLVDFLLGEQYDLEMIHEAIAVKKSYEATKQGRKARLLALRKEASETFGKVDKLTKLMNQIKAVR